MIRVTKYKTKSTDHIGNEIDVLVYRVLDGDKIICTQSIQDIPNAESMAFMKMARFMFNNIEVNEITEVEDKELVEKNKLNNIEKDFE